MRFCSAHADGRTDWSRRHIGGEIRLCRFFEASVSESRNLLTGHFVALRILPSIDKVSIPYPNASLDINILAISIRNQTLATKTSNAIIILKLFNIRLKKMFSRILFYFYETFRTYRTYVRLKHLKNLAIQTLSSFRVEIDQIWRFYIYHDICYKIV